MPIDWTFLPSFSVVASPGCSKSDSEAQSLAACSAHKAISASVYSSNWHSVKAIYRLTSWSLYIFAHLSNFFNDRRLLAICASFFLKMISLERACFIIFRSVCSKFSRVGVFPLIGHFRTVNRGYGSWQKSSAITINSWTQHYFTTVGLIQSLWVRHRSKEK